jgi:hypothetical protein
VASRLPANGLIAQKVQCGAGISKARPGAKDSSGASASKLTAVSSPDCDIERPDGKKITIDNARYVQDSATGPGGATNFDFPGCGTMSADVTFDGFSAAELADMAPRLAMQTIVNVSPAGQLKCVDDAVCLASKDKDADSTCYYCDLCSETRHKDGILSKVEADSACDDPLARKKRLSARICPLDENNKQQMCHFFSKTATDPYWQKKGDVDVKFLLYLRRPPQNPNEDHITYLTREYNREKASPFFAFTTKLKLQAQAAASRDGILSLLGGGGRSTPQEQEFKIFEEYVKQENGKGTLLGCQKFVGDYDLFGTGISKIADLASNNVDSLLGRRKAECDQMVKAKQRERYAGILRRL